MPYIVRQDGEHFVIPSYRDVLTARQKSALKKDILALSASYGEYITLRQKSSNQYEVAFSNEAGYLLGESVWNHFKRPVDMIYCEAIPETQEVILVIVKSGSVYLDGSFSTDSIADELVIFLTQQNNFDIFIHGDVPLSEKAEVGKFSFDASSVKSFTKLDAPVFETLEKYSIYKLQLVEPVLKANRIGTFPVLQLIGILCVIGLGWMFWSYMSAPTVKTSETEVNPFQAYYDGLSTPSPTDELSVIQKNVNSLLAMPGWTAKAVKYSRGSMTVGVVSNGAPISALQAWADKHEMVMALTTQGVTLTRTNNLSNRPAPTHIFKLTDVIASVFDKIVSVYPGNHFSLAEANNRGVFQGRQITVQLDNQTPMMLAVIGGVLNHLPLNLVSADLTLNNGFLTGTLVLQALGD